MLLRVKQYIASMQESEQTFDDYFLAYVKKIQDKNITQEVKKQLRFNLLQLSHLDKQIEADYRKMVNDLHAKFN